MMPRIRLFVAVFIAVNIIMIFSVAEEDSTPFTSVVLQRKRTNYLNFAGKTYYFGTVFKANFYRAMQFCRQQGMQLVSIQSKAENDRLGRFAEEIGAPHGHYWLSGTNLAEENQWIWLSTGNNFVYSNWHPGEPSGTGSSNTSENCVEARHWGKGFTWNDLRCNAELNFICETLESCS